jgi:hypothetical protein
MKRLVLSISLMIWQYSFSADFMHDLGLGFWSKIRNNNTGQPTSYGPHIHYMPRINFRLKGQHIILYCFPSCDWRKISSDGR